MTIEGIPDGWELVRIGMPDKGEYFLGMNKKPVLCNLVFKGHSYVIIRKIEKPKQYRPFDNPKEYFKSGSAGLPVDWENRTSMPAYNAVVSINDNFVWVAFGTNIERFAWEQAFKKLVFRHADKSTSPFGIEVTK